MHVPHSLALGLALDELADLVRLLLPVPLAAFEKRLIIVKTESRAKAVAAHLTA
jgi:hypothetical protein